MLWEWGWESTQKDSYERDNIRFEFIVIMKVETSNLIEKYNEPTMIVHGAEEDTLKFDPGDWSISVVNNWIMFVFDHIPLFEDYWASKIVQSTATKLLQRIWRYNIMDRVSQNLRHGGMKKLLGRFSRRLPAMSQDVGWRRCPTNASGKDIWKPSFRELDSWFFLL